jgi:tRNA threonylcarbamoyladenosine modification (KEOPS) complex  Pcc1 subunit
MVGKEATARTDKEPMQFWLIMRIIDQKGSTTEALLAMLQPEFDAIDSKRVRLQVTPTRNQLEFHLAAKDVKALRAASTSLLRLFVVAEGVLQLTKSHNRGEENE